MKRSVVRVRHAGKVDYENISKVEPTYRWYKLKNEKGVIQRIFGYGGTIGPWTGYLQGDLKEVPCSHCGRTGVFGGNLKSHWCDGRNADNPGWNHEAHDCQALPSFSWHGVKRWEIIGNVLGKEGWRAID